MLHIAYCTPLLFLLRTSLLCNNFLTCQLPLFGSRLRDDDAYPTTARRSFTGDHLQYRSEHYLDLLVEAVGKLWHIAVGPMWNVYPCPIVLSHQLMSAFHAGFSILLLLAKKLSSWAMWLSVKSFVTRNAFANLLAVIYWRSDMQCMTPFSPHLTTRRAVASRMESWLPNSLQQLSLITASRCGMVRPN